MSLIDEEVRNKLLEMPQGKREKVIDGLAKILACRPKSNHSWTEYLKSPQGGGSATGSVEGDLQEQE